MKSFIRSKKAMLVFFLLLVLVLKYPVLDAPFFMDVKFWSVPTSLWIAQNNFYPVLGKGLPRELIIDHPSHVWFKEDVADAAGHPPLKYELLALLYALFGCSHRAFHLAFLVIGALTLYYTYLLGRNLFDPWSGFFSSMMLLFSPLFFAQIGQLNDDVMVMLFAVVAVYEYINNRLIGYLVASVCLVLSKESSLVIILFILVHAAARNRGWKVMLQRRVKKLIRERKLYIYILPFFVQLGWMIWRFCEKGWAIYTTRKYPTDLLDYFYDLARVSRFIFISQGRFLLIPGIIYLIFAGFSKLSPKQKQVTGLCLGLTLSLTAFFSSFDVFFHMRYYLPIFPFLFLLATISLRTLFKKKLYLTAFIMAICLIFSLFWHVDPKKLLEANMYYFDVLTVKKEAAAFMKENFPERKIWTEEYLYADYAYPYVGYVEKPMNVVLIPPPNAEIEYEPGDLIIETHYCWSWYKDRKLHERIEALPKELVKRFESGHEYLNVYELKQASME